MHLEPLLYYLSTKLYIWQCSQINRNLLIELLKLIETIVSKHGYIVTLFFPKTKSFQITLIQVIYKNTLKIPFKNYVSSTLTCLEQEQ